MDAATACEDSRCSIGLPPSDVPLPGTGLRSCCSASSPDSRSAAPPYSAPCTSRRLRRPAGGGAWWRSSSSISFWESSLAYVSNYLIGLLNLGAAEWRWKLGVSVVPAVFFFVMLLGIPRSPRWLVKKRRVSEARQVLIEIGEQDVDGELKAIVASMSTTREQGRERLFCWRYRKPIMLAILVAFFNQVSGHQRHSVLPQPHLRAGGLQQGLGRSAVHRRRRHQPALHDDCDAGHRQSGAAPDCCSGDRSRWSVCLTACFVTLHTAQRESFADYPPGRIHRLLRPLVREPSSGCTSVRSFPNSVRSKGQSLGSSTHWIMSAALSIVFPQLTASSVGHPFAFFAGDDGDAVLRGAILVPGNQAESRWRRCRSAWKSASDREAPR